MKQFFQNPGYKMQGFMQGRYGMDEMSRSLSWAGIAFMLISMLLARLQGQGTYVSAAFETIGFALVIYSTIRIYSRNIYKRQQEREKYLKAVSGVKSWFSLLKKRFSDRNHVYVRCSCGTVLRAPKGKGKIRLHCPNCGKEKTVKS